MNLEKNSPPKNDSWKWLLVVVVLIVLFAFGYDGSRDASPKQNRPAKTVSEIVAAVKSVATPAPKQRTPQAVYLSSRAGVACHTNTTLPKGQ